MALRVSSVLQFVPARSQFGQVHQLEVRLRRVLTVSLLGLSGALAGCGSDQPPTPQRAIYAPTEARNEIEKPLPPPAREDLVPPPPFSDPPLVSQRLPEEQAFVNAYNAVGRPRILVFVNRTPDLQGNAPIQLDETQARSLDYAAVENILTDWLSADNRVALISPGVGQQQLSQQQSHDLQSGRAQAGRDVAQQIDAQILVQVRAQPTRQTAQGMEVRMVAEAIDLKHCGASLARGVVDVMPPLDKIQINVSTRFLARKLMDGMIASWQSFSAPPAGPREQPAPAPPPTRNDSPAPPAPLPPPLVPSPAPQTSPAPSADTNAPPAAQTTSADDFLGGVGEVKPASPAR